MFAATRTLPFAVVLGFSAFSASAEVLRIDTKYDAASISFTIDNRSIFTENIAAYQAGDSIAAGDIIKGEHSVFVRLGRDNDMFMIAAFKRDGNKVCAKHLMVRLRDGRDIGTTRLGSSGGRELYGITFGRKNDLYNAYGIRDSDFVFVFDPRAPRTGRNRNPDTPIVRVGNHDVLDKGCK
ncbi:MULTISPECIES: hypothetical protein [Rhizobium]|uniref:hypothetical protein n=1 Tax=Rhizobium TaxID=379 RepID=UPI00102F39FB|nr:MULTISPECIES: hypothetical protein [Rhizobium]MBA1343934.1 hypothetical protein [Rhizobium sp. WYCCWR 11146]TBG52572.1 hypothetical protein ELG74_36355 [Rhizobium leguminosarum]